MVSDFKFTIFDIASILRLVPRKTTSEGQYYDCPFCSGSKKEGKLYLNYVINAFRCNRCGNHGGMLKLYADSMNIDNLGVAKREIEEHLNLNKTTTIKVKPYSPIKDRVDVDSTNINEIDKVYRALLKELTLFDYHKQRLYERGLTTADIKKYQYKSMPIFAYKQIANKLINNGFKLVGIPGFYRDKNNDFTLNFRNDSPGILIPSFNLDGKIVCLEKRLDTPYKDTRYFRITSAGKLDGSKSVSSINFCGDVMSDTIYLTEGSFKSSIAHSLSKKTFAGMPGVSNYKILEPFFKQLKLNGTKRIVEAFDMDKLTNPNVKKMRFKIINMIEDYGFISESLTWDSKYKGIDDFLLSCQNQNDK